MEYRQRFSSHLKKNMINIDRNIYISQSDPLYYEKVLRYLDPESAEAHYKLGEKNEESGNVEKATFHYSKSTQTSSPYYFQAKRKLVKIQGQNNPNGTTQTAHVKATSSHHSKLTLLLIMTLILTIMLVLSLFSPIDSVRAVVSMFNPTHPSMNVVHESVDTSYIVYIPLGESIDQIEKKLFHKAIEISKNLDGQNVLLYGMWASTDTDGDKVYPITNEKQKQQAFVFARYNSSVDEAVQIRFLNPEFQPESHNETNKKPLLFVGANFVRTALQHYIEVNGEPPLHIEQLLDDYPNNYMSFIPKEAVTGSARVVNEYDGQGGWVYNREATPLAEIFYPNLPGESIPFEPFILTVSKQDFLLQLTSGPYSLFHTDVGLGKENRTPEGSFTVAERVLNPIGKHSGIYGMAGLGLGDIAIHGTNEPDSVKANQSLGCIRLSNTDIVQLFPLAPIGTEVTITDSNLLHGEDAYIRIPIESIFPTIKPDIKQTAGGKVFDWLG